MGTLTAGQPRLDHYCEHKLPTSCRLSSIGECCACYDERAHAASYQTYIDGVGFVSRGTRWQRYCWFCKEFWENRVQASGLRPGQTRIPEVPDQSEFLQHWYEFHQGYRIVRREDGTEDRIAVLGEDLKDVSPGFLPRTLEELRAGRERNEEDERERQAAQTAQTGEQEHQAESGPTLEETLDQMLLAADREEEAQGQQTENRSAAVEVDQTAQSTGTNIHSQAMVPAGSRSREYQARRVAALRRELHRMRNGIERVISGLRELGENVPDHADASNSLTQLSRTLDTISQPSQEDAQRAISAVNALTNDVASAQHDRTLANIQSRVDSARQQVEEARRNREQAQTELDAAEQEFRSSQSRLRQIQNEQRTTENYIRLFGTREEMNAQGENYESPIGGMFTRAYERFRVAEEVRRETRTLRQVLQDEERMLDASAASRLADLETRERDVWGVPQSQSRPRPRPRTATESRRGNPPGPVTDPTDLSDADEPQVARPINPPLGSQRGTSGAIDLTIDLNRHASRPRRHNERPLSRARNEAPLLDMYDLSMMDPESDQPEQSRIVAGPPGHQLDEDPSANNDRGLDAAFVLVALTADETLRRVLPSNPRRTIITRLLRSAEDNSLTESDRNDIQAMIENQSVVWNSRLPTERNRRRRARGEQVSFTPDAFDMASSGQVIVHDVEIMAECFQMSSQVRWVSGLTGPEQLAMLFRLQRGERSSQDREVLATMLRNDAAFRRAQTVHEQNTGSLSDVVDARQTALDESRHAAARRGNHSRAELDASRQGVALAAARTAGATSPADLLERIANRDEGTRAAYQRLQENGLAPPGTMTSRRLREAFYRPLSLDDFTASPSASDSENDAEEEPRGLDARDTGRPEEALTEEEMTVLLDCRICYSQKAEICTLPCGHLTMCRWCSEQHSPCMPQDHTRPRRAANCPVCRKQIRQKVRVIRS